MTRRNKRSNQYIGIGLTTKQPKRKKPIGLEYLANIEPITENQKRLFESYIEGKHIVAHGSPGTGKTLITLYNALKEVLDERTPYEKVYIARSLLPTRDVGYLPGDLSEKSDVYQNPYKSMVKRMFLMPSDVDFEMLYGNLKSQGSIEFISTSFLRGITLDDCIIVVDEFSNLNFHELCSIITRSGENCKIMFCGDINQSDLVKNNDRDGVYDFMRILKDMPSFDVIEFGIDDIVRSKLVKQFMIAKMNCGF